MRTVTRDLLLTVHMVTVTSKGTKKIAVLFGK